MEFTGLGSGALLALAAVLWLVYLVPSWLRRSEYLATERNALRLQRTIRVLAETTEIPMAVQTDTSARSAAAHQRSLRQQQRLTDAVNHAQASAAARRHAARIVETQPALAHVVVSTSLAARRLRRTRAFTALIMVASIVTFFSQATLMITTGVAPAAPAVLTGAGVMAATTFLFLGRVAAISRARARAHVPVAVAPRRRLTSYEVPVQQEQPRTWTPVEMPKPLYLSRDVAERPAFDQRTAVAGLQDAAAQSDRALRSTQSPAAAEVAEAPTVAPMAPAAARSATPAAVARPAMPAGAQTANRFAAMGIVDADIAATPNLDEVLRRRRQAAS
jgi:hypothetical protein